MPLQETSGNVTADAYGGGVAAVPNYIENVFSTYLYTGNGSTQTITNGIDLAGKGGLTWIKIRNTAYIHVLTDTARGVSKYLDSSTTGAQSNTSPYGLTSFNANGFSINDDSPGNYGVNGNGYTFASWTFRKQPKFFDVVTYTGDGTSGRNIAHALGSTPGFVVVKCTSASGYYWICYHQSLGATKAVYLQATSAAVTYSGYWNDTAPTSTVFTVGSDTFVNESGQTYVAYLFAHNAGGFGLTGTDNVISCGSFTADSGGNATVNLGYEPQWVMIKQTTGTGNWFVVDNMRNFAQTVTASLSPNLSNAESPGFGGGGSYFFPTATGFQSVQDLGANTPYIYIAIRRGPMAVPTTGTSVFAPVDVTSTSTPATVTTNFPVDFLITTQDARYSANTTFAFDRLRGSSKTSGVYLQPPATSSETTTSSSGIGFDNNTAIIDNGILSGLSQPTIYWNFSRAPSFFDEVCFKSANGTQTHNLGVAPELVIMKTRSAADSWYVFAAQNGYGIMNNTNAWGGLGNGSGLGVNLANVTSTTLSAFSNFEGVGVSCVAYLFASCPNVSKVGTYTGNGITQTINCGFTGGARFVLIKRTDASGDWYVYDTARGMTTLTDPYLLMNGYGGQTATLGSVTTVTGGFAVNASILAAINTNAASYIFLAIA